MKKITLLAVAFLCTVALKAQDDCDSATEITDDGTYTVESVDGSAPGADEVCYQGQNGPVTADNAEWYSFTAGDEDLLVTVNSDVESNPDDGDTRLTIYSGSCSELECYNANDDIVYDQANDPSENNYYSAVEFIAEAGETYYIVWDDQWSAAGFDFEVSTTTDVPEAPGVATNPTPEDGATGVEIIQNAGPDEDQLAVAFEWDAPTTGSEASSYTFQLTQDPNFSENVISGSFENTSVTIYITQNDPDSPEYFQNNTTYYWRIIPVNSNGTSGSQEDAEIWSFTTEAMASVNQNEALSFEQFINKNNLIIKAKSPLNTVEVYNLLGQQVLTQNLNDSREASINLSNLTNGVYITKVQINGQTQSFKFVK